MTEEIEISEMPESTEIEILDKIEAYAWEIRGDWTDPRGECRTIVRLVSLYKLRYLK